MKFVFKHVLSFVAILSVGLLFSGCTPNFLTKEPRAGIQISTEQISCAVFLNGQYIDSTPLTRKNLKPGEYVLEIKPTDESLAPYSTTVMLRKDILTYVTWIPGETPAKSEGVLYEMEPLPNTDESEISFTSVPDGAIIQLAENPKEIAPYTFKNVPAGETEYSVSLPSYKVQKHSINVIPGYRMLISVKLSREFETITVSNILTPTASASATASESATASPSAAIVTILKTNVFVDGIEVLRLRESPSVSAKEIGLVEVGKDYTFLGEKKDGWLKINTASGSGWVSGTFSNLKEF